MRLMAGLLVAVLFVCPAVAQRDGGSTGGEDLEEFQKLLEILDEETTIATKTKLNSDYVPGMVTVLQGEDLEVLGITTVWEALSLVPGIQIYRSGLGDPFVTVRGLQFPFNSGNIKILINSIAMSRETSSINTSALLLPVEQVERIEVIRGPGSSVYGNFAFMGLVNIVTQKGENGAFAGLVDGDRYAGGARIFAGNADVRFNANLAGWTSNDGEGPVDIPSEEDRLSAVVSLEYRNTSFAYQMFDRNYATASVGVAERNQAVAVRHHQEFAGNWYVDLEGNYLNSDLDAPNVGFQGDLVQGEADLGWAGRRMNWLLALSGANANIDHAELSRPNRPENIQVDNSGWETFGASLQGQFHGGETFTVTAGLRYDERLDLDASHVTPRLAFVWRAHEHHLVKGQYTEGFRAPTFFELYGLGDLNTNLDFETVGATELSYVFRDLKRTARATLFFSRFKNMIFPYSGTQQQAGQNGQSQPRGTFSQQPPPGQPPPGQPPPGQPPVFRNISRATSRGVELEWEQQLHPAFKWAANLSYATSEDTRNNTLEEVPSEGLATWLGNLSFVVRPRRNLLFSSHLYYVGDRKTREGDVEGFKFLDVSVSAFHAGVKGLTLQGSVKNVLNETVRHILNLPSGPNINIYDGRTWQVQVEYEF